MKIYLNAGHGVNIRGGYDPGAVGPTGLREADVTAAVAERCAAYLRAARFEVLGDFVFRASFATARQYAMQKHADALVSIHCNAAVIRTAQGVETLYRVTSGLRLAEEIQDAVVEGVTRGSLQYPVKDRGVKRRGDLGVLNTGATPSALVECFFISNPTEEAMLANPDVVNSLAWCIAEGIKVWGAKR
jgi:N-acetylmuramoyl-L-alanine amidase